MRGNVNGVEFRTEHYPVRQRVTSPTVVVKAASPDALKVCLNWFRRETQIHRR